MNFKKQVAKFQVLEIQNGVLSFFIGTSSGVTNSRTTTGTLTFVVPSDSPATLYYNCGNHSGMGGTITVQ